jgi:RNA polymerase sigma-70 factor (ECF subfamily)
MSTSEFDTTDFLERLRTGEKSAYRLLIRRFHASLVSVACSVIGSRAQAEEVVQDTWLTVFRGISRFEGRSSLTTWLFAIALNRARTRVRRERRSVSLPVVLEDGQPHLGSVAPSAFTPAGRWAEMPRMWDELHPERIVGDRQLGEHVRNAIEALPSRQRAVIVMRDLDGRSSRETCELLRISPENQRVLLHRARVSIRETVAVLIDDSPRTALAARTGGAASSRVWELPVGSMALAG